MIVVAIVGILAVLAIYGVRKYIANAKTAEARNSLGQIAKDAAVPVEREQGTQAVLAAGSQSALIRAFCASAAASVPASVPTAQKYQSSAADWNAGNSTTGWACLKFSLEEPQYYMYSYSAGEHLGDQRQLHRDRQRRPERQRHDVHVPRERLGLRRRDRHLAERPGDQPRGVILTVALRWAVGTCVPAARAFL